MVGGFVLSLAVVLACRLLIPAEDFAAWGWRLPFLLSILLLAISLWMRLKLSESPVFQAMKEAGKTSRNPVRRELHLSRQQEAHLRRAVRRRLRA